ncbi:hypothetical protein [Mycobacterium heckeshornense]|uniref:hypothetical protein n=1 Tax=Mycobacterium heckeshornense TaxID=110505 RepID=UPI001F455E62|nr:hypothetical protein [Mycobacterium heckeshornense]
MNPAGGVQVRRARRGYERARILITVKTYPNPSLKYDETVCVAGVRIDRGVPEWIRLYPVRFRNVDEGAQFEKYEVIEVDVVAHGVTDSRIEPYRPDQQSIEHIRKIGTKNDWAERRELIGGLRGATTTCALTAAATKNSMDVPAPSLGLIKPIVTAVKVSAGKPWDDDQLRKIERASQPDLFGEGLRPLEPMPFEVRYGYRCAESQCRGHVQKVLDWELGQAGRRWRRQYGSEAVNQIRKRWGEEMTAAERDLYFFVGNQHQRRGSFSVLGTWWPRRNNEQLSLFRGSHVDHGGVRPDLE